MKRVVLVHGWEGRPSEGWFPWFESRLRAEGVEVIAPELPGTEAPHIDTWVPALTHAVGDIDVDTYFVGHSLGCQAIMRLIERAPSATQAGGAVFVAGFFLPLRGLVTIEEIAIDKEWAETPIDTELVRSRLGRSVAFFSDDDPDVPIANAPLFADRLGSKVHIEHGYGHFSEDAGCMELPLAYNALRGLMD